MTATPTTRPNPAPAEHLTDGWDDAVDVSDSLLRRFVHHHAATVAAFATSLGGGETVLDGAHVADVGRPAGFWNAVTLTRPPRDWDGLLDDVLATVDGGRGEVLLWSAWPTPDLRRRGFDLYGHPPLLVRPPHDAVPAAERAGTVSLTEVRDPAGLAAWEQVVVDGYPLPELQPFTHGTVAGPDVLGDARVRLWVGNEGDDAVSVGTSFDAFGLASLALGVTLPTARGRGHWWAHATTRLRAHADRWVAGIFSDHSRPLAEALGFVPINRFTLWRIPRP